MKILYGVQCTGNGHITRSSKIIRELSKSGCRVDVVTSGNNSKVNLPFPIKYNFKGLTFYYDGNGKIDYWKTFYDLNLIKLFKDIKLDISNYDLIITDFEPITAWSAKLSGKNSIGISNQYSFLSKETPRPSKKSFIGEFLLENLAPVKNPIGIHFEKYDEFIKTPILRENIYSMQIQNKGHYTVYLSNWTTENLMKYFKDIDTKFEIFTNIKKPTRYKNCFFKPIEKTLFDVSLKNCQGIITAGGFQTCSEALYLNKELFVIPIENQYEQMCNAEALKRLGVKVGNLEMINTLINLPKTQKIIQWDDPTNEIINEILNFRIK